MTTQGEREVVAEFQHQSMNPVKLIDPTEAERGDQAVGTIIALTAISLVIVAGIGVTVSALAAVLMGLG